LRVRSLSISLTLSLSLFLFDSLSLSHTHTHTHERERERERREYQVRGIMAAGGAGAARRDPATPPHAPPAARVHGGERHRPARGGRAARAERRARVARAHQRHAAVDARAREEAVLLLVPVAPRRPAARRHLSRNSGLLRNSGLGFRVVSEFGVWGSGLDGQLGSWAVGSRVQGVQNTMARRVTSICFRIRGSGFRVRRAAGYRVQGVQDMMARRVTSSPASGSTSGSTPSPFPACTGFRVQGFDTLTDPPRDETVPGSRETGAGCRVYGRRVKVVGCRVYGRRV
jgi:hypothetical protein